jgi:acetyl esterase/lipase
VNRRAFLLSCPAILWPRGLRSDEAPTLPRSSRGRELASIIRSIQVKEALAYVRRPQRNLNLRIYSPRQSWSKPLPLVLCFGLAAWAWDDVRFPLDLEHLLPAPTLNLYPPALVPRGYIVVAAELRTSAEAVFPAQILDARCALHWVLKNSQALRADPGRIGLLGASSSAHIAALLALSHPCECWQDPRCKLPAPVPVKAVCAFAGMYDFELYQRDAGSASLQKKVTSFLGGSFADKPGVYREASPIGHVTPQAPAFFLMHGRQDDRVPYSQTLRFKEKLDESRVPVEFVSVDQYGHGPLAGRAPNPGYEEIDRRVDAFLDKHLKHRS